MSLLRAALLGLHLAIGSALAAPSTMDRRRDANGIEWIDHDKVVPFAETFVDDDVCELYTKYRPTLVLTEGCVPFPAVDARGRVGGGLKQTGPINGKCSQSTGQLYVRSGNHRNRFGILYAYYFPKEEPSPSVGHRHDWQSLVLWKADDKINSTLLGVATSVHGQYHQYPYAQNRDDWDDNHPLVSYVNTWLLSYYLAPSADNTPVQPLPMIDWDSLPDVAQYALNNADFGDAAVPFKDDNFDLHLEKAWLDHV